jgi:hypothetical protein
MKTLLLTLLLTASAMAAETPAAVTTTGKPETVAPVATTPKQACEALAKAAAEDNYKAFQDMTAMPSMMGHSCDMKGDTGNACAHKECTDKNCPMGKHGKGMAKGKGKGKGMGMDHSAMQGMMHSEEGFHKMHAKEMERLKDLACMDEKISADHAWVEVKSQNETRLVPFKKVEGQWKFDIHTYHAFYQPPVSK